MATKKTKSKYEVVVNPHINISLNFEVEARSEKEAIRIVQKSARKELQRELAALARDKSHTRMCTATIRAAPAIEVTKPTNWEETTHDELPEPRPSTDYVEEEWNL
jgi:hypothetical protein